jgi:hypothetical protein
MDAFLRCCGLGRSLLFFCLHITISELIIAKFVITKIRAHVQVPDFIDPVDVSDAGKV